MGVSHSYIYVLMNLYNSRGQRRRDAGVDGQDLDAALFDRGQQAVEVAQVHHVAEAVAVRLGHDGEVGHVADGREQVASLHALEPERRPLATPRARQEERAAGIDPEAGAEDGRVGQLAQDALPGLTSRHPPDYVCCDGEVGAGECGLPRHTRRQRALVLRAENDAGQAEEDAVVHSPFGGRINGAWALALVDALKERTGIEIESQVSDDGILLRLPGVVLGAQDQGTLAPGGRGRRHSPAPTLPSRQK